MRYLALIVFTALFSIGGLAASTAQAQDSIGKVTRIQGTATEAVGENTLPLEAGSLIHMNSIVRSGPDSRLEIVFTDASQLTLGEEASIRMDDLVYSPSNPSSKNTQQVLEVFSGTFRFLSGAIGRQNPESVRISTPVATIGIRGTDLFGGPLASGMPPGQVHYGVMIISGAIEVRTPEGAVVLDQANEGTFLPMAGGKAPTDPSVWGQEAIDEAYASIAFR
ncbi:MAG: FecR domain-containing protein [Alphaproteobacteria bacterium]|nr:FecR domain-containing protein [Alphaproteobacteria bacterium]